MRQAAVLMPLVRMNGDWCLVFTRRTQTVQNHKGQVSFPGGAAEPQDYSLENTALREAHEEIGLHPNQVRLLGRMAQMRTITEYLITPVVGITSWPFEMQLSLDEVERVFTIPLDWLADQRNREEKWIVLRNARQDRMVIYHPYDGEILWGITARLTLNLLRLLGLTD
ncbi:MAG TPA: CoA pyrophosphatase [Anaerolineaceae bacterium]|nr:CoA pyrophosphatase [Anaerolineaceae bacterium]